MISTFAGSGEAPRIDFDDPDFILAIDAIHGRAGVATTGLAICWSGANP